MKKAMEATKKFFNDNKDVIIRVAMLTAAGIVYKKFGISNDIFAPTSRAVFPSVTTPSAFELPIMVSNKEQAAMLSIYNTTKTYTWDSDKVRAARDIRAMIKPESTDETKRFAIGLLSKIVETMTWDSDKIRITDMIKAIGTD